MEKRKENMEKKLTNSALLFSERIVLSFQPYVNMPIIDRVAASSQCVVCGVAEDMDSPQYLLNLGYLMILTA
jgi:hypothetical protein